MFHSAILQPIVVKSQQLIVVSKPRTIATMSSEEKEGFARRMNRVADLLKIPPKGQNRQFLLGKKFHVSQESARKWLEGESFPTTEKCIEIAKEANVSFEWFVTGRGDEPFIYEAAPESPEETVLRVMEKMDEQDKYKLVQLTKALATPPPVSQPESDPKPANRGRMPLHGPDATVVPEKGDSRKRKTQ
jgi:hypothetical protein